MYIFSTFGVILKKFFYNNLKLEHKALLWKIKLKSLIFNTRRRFFYQVTVQTFFSEVSNVQDKTMNLLVCYFIYVCHSKQKRVLKAKV